VRRYADGYHRGRVIRGVKEAFRTGALGMGRSGLRRLAERHPVFTGSLIDSVRPEPPPVPDDDDFLRDLYERLLGRPIDLDGLTGYRKALARGMSRADVVYSLALSDEYRARCRPVTNRAAAGGPRSRRPESYRFDPELSLWTFTVESDSDFDWLEQVILQDGYYEQPGVWSLVVDTDKRMMAEIIALLCRGRVLEVGCASGALLEGLHDRGLAFDGIDISALAIGRASANVKSHIHHGDLLTLNLANDFDTVVGLDIFEHLNPNRLAAYLERLRSCLLPGGLVFANIPAFGQDEVFGEVLPYYISDWEVDTAAGRCFRTLHVDDDGYPVNGHLIWAHTRWWVRQFIAAGFERRPAIEMALHEKYDDYLSVQAQFRRAFYVFSAGDCQSEKLLVERIRLSESSILDEYAAAMHGSGSR
jgi:SAM-dependent methyltransferase